MSLRSKGRSFMKAVREVDPWSMGWTDKVLDPGEDDDDEA